MSLIFIDGFGGGDVPEKWDISSSALTLGTAGARTAGGYYGITGAQFGASKSFPAAAQIFFGHGVYPVGNNYFSFYGDNGTTAHITIQRNTTSGFLEIRRGGSGGTLLATGTTIMPNSVWGYIEASVTISDTIGQVHVRVNGGLTDDVSYTGDTKNGGTNTTIDRIIFNPDTFVSGGGTRYTDVYILNSLGSAPNNTFLGDIAVRVLSPSGNGTYSQLTNSAGNSTSNYSYVDEHAYSAADYVGSATVGQKDTYSMADLPGGVTNIYALQVTGKMAKTDVSLGQARYVLRSSGTDYSGTTRALSTSYITYSDLYETDPASGSAWTMAGVNGSEAGMEIV